MTAAGDTAVADTASAGLDVAGLSVRFGGVVALDDVTLQVPAGALHGLIGPNGAGKSSFGDAVSGFCRPASGTVTVAGRDCTGREPHEVVRAGLARTFQSLRLFHELTVAEHVELATMQARHGRARRSGRSVGPTPAEVLELAGLAEQAPQRPGSLTDVDRRRLSVARALATDPVVLVVDEPVAGLDDAGRRRVVDLLRRIVGSGVAVIVIEHDLELVLRECSIVHVLDRGRLVASGPPEAIRSEAAVLSAGWVPARRPEAEPARRPEAEPARRPEAEPARRPEAEPR